MLNDFLNHGDVRHQIQLRNIGDLRIPLYTATQSQLFVRYRAINMFVYLFSLVLKAGTSPQKSISARREQVPFSMAIGNGELMHECFPKHPRMGTAR